MLKPYYDHAGITIYHGDCREILPLLPEVDAIVTDPPYCSGGFSEVGKQSAKGMGLRSETIKEVGWFVNDNMTTAGAVWLLSTVAGWARQILKPGGTLTVFTDWRMVGQIAPAIESSGFRYQNLLVWAKPSPGLGTGFRAQHELAAHFSNGTPDYHSFSYGNVLSAGRVQDREHQTQKPLELMNQILAVVSTIDQTILDPFMGSGTTLVAAKLLNRKAIGIELEEKYCEIAVKRLAQDNLFTEVA